MQACFRKVRRALFIRAIFFLVTASINVSLLPVYSTTSCPSSTTDFFGILLEKNSFKSNSYFIRQSTTIGWTKRLLVIAKVRTQRTCALYCNSTLTFRTLLKLIFDIELNPGPNGSFNCSVKANTRNINNVMIAHLNVRSLKCRDHFLLVKDTILSNKFDVFTISESWLDVSVSDLEIEVPGYNIYRVDRSNKTGGGICAYVLNTYCTELMGDISDISTTGFHQLWLKIQVRNLKSIIICTVYRPPDTPLTCWENDLTTTLIYALSLDKPVYIMGDLNCNLLSTECRELKSLTSFYESFNLSQLIAAPTRVTESSWSLLDVILASQTKQVVKAGVMDSSISDHDMVFAILHLKVSQPKTTHITTRSLKNYNPDTFQFDMSGAPWSVVIVFDDVDDI